VNPVVKVDGEDKRLWKLKD